MYAVLFCAVLLCCCDMVLCCCAVLYCVVVIWCCAMLLCCVVVLCCVVCCVTGWDVFLLCDWASVLCFGTVLLDVIVLC